MTEEGCGFDESDPLTPHENENNDDDEGDRTTPFQPGASSTPGPSGENIPMRTTTMNRPAERGSHTVETSFIEGCLSGPVLTLDEMKITLANETQQYPEYGKDGNFLTLEVSKGKNKDKVVVIGPRGGETPLFKADGKINPKLPKQLMKTLGPERSELIQQKPLRLPGREFHTLHLENISIIFSYRSFKVNAQK